MFSKILWRAQPKKALHIQCCTLLMSLGAGAFAALQAWATACIINLVFFEKRTVSDTVDYFILLIAAILLRGLFLMGEEFFALKVSGLVKGELLKRVLEHADRLGPAAMLHQDMGAFMTLLTQGLATMDAYFCRYLPQLFKSAIIPVLYLCIALPMDWIIFLIFVITTPLIPLFMILIGKWTHQMKNSSWEALSRMGGYLQDVLAGLTTLRNWNREYRQEKQIRDVSRNFRLQTLKTLRIAFLSAFVLELLTTISIALIAVSLGIRLAEGTTPFLPALFLILLAPEYYQPLRMLGQQYHNSQNAILAADEIFLFLKEPVLAITPPVSADKEVSAPELIMDHVSFTYPKGTQALADISIRLQAGKIYALAGPSGAGKTTFLRILSGSLLPTAGSLQVDGASFQGWEGLAYIPAQPYFFHGNVLDNITLGRDIPFDTVQAVCRKIGAEEFILQLPDGYHTSLGQQGISLSGGQGQLIAIARAMVSPARMVLCDEATGSLDTQSEERVEAALKELFVGKTVVISAHRLHTLRLADTVLVLQEGKLVQLGSYEELAGQEGGPFLSMLEKGMVS